MRKHECVYGVIFATRDGRIRVVRSVLDFVCFLEYKYNYPYIPERLMRFKYCPDCGKPLMGKVKNRVFDKRDT